MKYRTKAINLTICFIILFTGCSSRPSTVRSCIISFHATEKSAPIDTMVVIPDWVKKISLCFSLETHMEWNDTIIYNGKKLPKYKFDADHHCVDGGMSILEDTIKFQFDKYKATKVNINVKYKL